MRDEQGMTVVVSPLIALMKDQADRLREKDISVAAVNSTLSVAELHDAEEAIAGGRVKFVYATPERMADPRLILLRRNELVFGPANRRMDSLGREVSQLEIESVAPTADI